jgi:hypothetical protein
MRDNQPSSRTVDLLVGVTFAIALSTLLVRAALRCFGADLMSLATAVQDDSFYYLVPAFLFHEHGFPTFDGIHPTYSGQPGFMAFLMLLATPFRDLESFFRAALFANHLLLAVASILAAVLVRRIARPFGDARAALSGWTAGALLGLNPSIVSGFTTIKENVMFSVLLLLAVNLALSYRDVGRRRLGVALGAALGAAAACRMTPSSFAVCGIVGLWACQWFRPRRLAIVAVGAVAVTLPWAIYTLRCFGRVLPTTGALKTAWLSGAWQQGDLGARFWESSGIVPRYLASELRYVLGFDHGFYVAQQESLGLPQSWWSTICITTVMVAALVAVVGMRQHCLRTQPAARLLLGAAAAAVLASALNPLLLDAGRNSQLLFYAQWYVAALPTVLLPWAALVFAGRRCDAPPRLATALAIVVIACCGGRSVLWLGSPAVFDPASRSMMARTAALWRDARLHLPVDARLGAWNAGILGFLSGGRVVNLDGLANETAANAILAHRSHWDSAREMGVDHVLDVLPVNGWFGTNRFDRLDLLHAIGSVQDPLDGGVVARLTGDRFPDFEPLASAPGVEVWTVVCPHPFRATPRAFACFHLLPQPGEAGSSVHFNRGGAGGEMRAWLRTRSARVVVAFDGDTVAEATPDSGDVELRLALGDTNVVSVTALAQGGTASAEAWLTDVSFHATSELLPRAQRPTGAYGSGYARTGAPMHLSLVADRGDGKHRVRVDAMPAGVAIQVIVSLAQASELYGPEIRALVQLPGFLQLPVASDGVAELPLESLPTSKTIYAQAVATRDGIIVATSQGLRIRL